MVRPGAPGTPGHNRIPTAHLVAVCVPADGDGLGPARDEARDVLADDGLSEDRAAEDVADGPVGALPHLLQTEL